MRYVTYDEDGNLTGCFLQEVSQAHKKAFLPIPESLAPAWTAYRMNASRDGIELAPAHTVALTVPSRIPRLNARLALLERGEWDDIAEFVRGLNDPVALAFFEDAQTWLRTNPLVNAWAAARKHPPSYIDELFIAAGALNV